MNLVEIASPAEALTPDDRASMAANVIEGLVGAEADEGVVPEETMAGARATTHVGFPEADRLDHGRWPVGSENAASPVDHHDRAGRLA